MIVLKVLYLAGSAAFLFGVAKYLAEWKKPVQDRVEYRTVEKPVPVKVPVERKVAVPVEKVHVTCFQCMHGTRDQGQPGRVYCRRFGYQMMPQAYCSMAEMNTDLVIRDKVQEAERLLDKSDDIMSRYRDAMEKRNAYASYQSTFDDELANSRLLEQLDDLKNQYGRSLYDHVRGR